MKYRLSMCLGAAASLLLTAWTAQAVVLFSENFDSMSTGSDLADHGWQTDAGQQPVLIVDQGGGDQAAQGAGTGSWHTYSSPLSTRVNSGFVWISFDFEADSDLGGATRQYAGLSQLTLGSVNGPNIRIGRDSTLGTDNFWIRPGGDWGNSFDTGIAAPGAPNTLVAGIDLDAGTAYFWANPDGDDFFNLIDGGTADALTTNVKYTDFSHFFINSYNVTYDNILVATTPAEVGLGDSGSDPEEIPEGTSRTTVWFDEPGTAWAEGFPIGTGRLGGVVYGGVTNETLVLSEDTIWSGGPTDYTNIGASNQLAHLRNLILTEQYDAAATYGADNNLGDPKTQKGFQSMARLHIEFPGHDAYTDYHRQLELSNATVNVSYKVDEATFSREIFASCPDQVMAIKFDSDQPSNLTFQVSLTSPHAGYTVQAEGTTGMALLGQADSIHFKTQLSVRHTGGTVSFADGTLSVTDADSVVLLLVAGSNHVNYNDLTADPAARCTAYLSAIDAKAYATLKAAHQTDFSALFNRVGIDLGAVKSDLERPTDELLSRYQSGNRSGLLEEQLFQFGRYMNISGARPGTQPLNLVGIWAEELNAPWGGKWTLNINAELNTWPVETTNLPECHEPLLDLIEDLRVTGRSVAREHYDCDGFVAHHNTDLWRGSAPVDTAIHGLWTTGSAWLCRHIWEHYDFSRDIGYLTTAYPTMKESAAFYEDFLIEVDGHLATCPSISFEQSFRKTDGTEGRLTYGPTMDNQILRDLFSNCIMAAEHLGVDADKVAEWTTIKNSLRPNQADPVTGRLMEWAFSAEKPGPSGQTAACWGVSPGREINFHDTPAIAQAAVDYLNYQIPRMPSYETGGSWVTGTLLNSWARLGKGPEAYGTIQKAIKERLYTNLMMHFYTQKYFEIDGNMGTTAGITEMLLQSQRLTAEKQPIIDLLPALPAQWPTGSIRGIKARGNFEIDLEWALGRLISVKVKSLKGTPLNMQYGGKTLSMPTEAGQAIEMNSDLEQFRITDINFTPEAVVDSLNITCVPGRSYEILCSPSLTDTWTSCSPSVSVTRTSSSIDIDEAQESSSLFFRAIEL